MEQKLGYYFSIALEKPVHEVCRQELSWEAGMQGFCEANGGHCFWSLIRSYVDSPSNARANISSTYLIVGSLDVDACRIPYRHCEWGRILYPLTVAWREQSGLQRFGEVWSRPFLPGWVALD